MQVYPSKNAHTLQVLLSSLHLIWVAIILRLNSRQLTAQMWDQSRSPAYSGLILSRARAKTLTEASKT